MDATEKLSIPMTPKEYAKTRIEAAKQGISMAEYGRIALRKLRERAESKSDNHNEQDATVQAAVA